MDQELDGMIKSRLRSLGIELEPESRLVQHEYPTVASAAPLAVLLLLYIVGSVLGRALISLNVLQANRKSNVLQQLQVAHNGFLIVLSLYMCIGLVKSAVRNGYNLWNNGYSDDEADIAWFCFLFYFSKLYEFADTAILVAKGNQQQISFLHVYHHASISVFWWIIAHRAPGGDSYFSAAVNSGVHVVMYTYYLLTTCIRSPEKRQKYLWWKKYLTQFQMTQFAINLVQAVYVYVYSPYPKFLSGMLVGYMISLLLLFSDFYYKRIYRKLGKDTVKHLDASSQLNGHSTAANGKKAT